MHSTFGFTLVFREVNVAISAALESRPRRLPSQSKGVPGQGQSYKAQNPHVPVEAGTLARLL